MDNLSSPPRDRWRYPAQEHKLVRRIKLSPVRENESENYREHWKRRSQVLGSVLHWAHDAGAIKVDFDPRNDEPFTYTTPEGGTVSTELGDTPTEYVNSIAQFIRDTIDGHPLIRPLRRLYRNLTKTAVEAEIEIPPTNVYPGSTWLCRMSGDTARFDKTSTKKPLPNAG
jgi:hypothetical protein